VNGLNVSSRIHRAHRFLNGGDDFRPSLRIADQARGTLLCKSRRTEFADLVDARLYAIG